MSRQDEWFDGRWPIRSKIRDLARIGEFDHVETLLVENPDKFFMTGAGTGASEGGHLKKAREFIARGADIDFVADSAAYGGHFHFCDELIKKGADVKMAVSGAFGRIGGDTEDPKYQSYVDELQIIWLANQSQQFQSRQQILDVLFAQLRRFSVVAEVLETPVTNNALNNAIKQIALKTKYAGLTDQQALSLLHYNNSGVMVLLLALKIFEGLKSKNGTSKFCNIPYVALMNVFSFVFGAEAEVLHHERGGFGLFLSAQRNKVEKMISERQTNEATQGARA